MDDNQIHRVMDWFWQRVPAMGKLLRNRLFPNSTVQPFMFWSPVLSHCGTKDAVTAAASDPSVLNGRLPSRNDLS